MEKKCYKCSKQASVALFMEEFPFETFHLCKKCAKEVIVNKEFKDKKNKTYEVIFIDENYAIK